MIKNKNLELLENSSVRLSVTVDKEFIQSEYDGLVQEYSKRIRMDGFRRGKVPASVLIGASFLMVVDNVSRTAFPTEIPLGILTAMIGAPVFAYLLTRKKVGWL